MILFAASALAYFAFFFLPHVFPPPMLIAFFVLGIVGPISGIIISHNGRRTKPQGYIGKFRRPDGVLVHVARLPSGQLMVASETQPPEDLGAVSGPELMRWQKVATEPDG